MKNKGMRLLAAVLLCGMLLLCPRVRADETADAAAPDPVFAGERSVVYAIDSGLLPNYLVGGKTALDGYLRVYQPDWLAVDFTAEERQILMHLSFSFSSMQDYRDKLAALSLRAPVLLYEEAPQLTYCENLTSTDLLNFLRSPMKKNGTLGALDFSVLFRFQSGSFVLNGQTYEATSPLCVNCSPADMTASGLQIRTTAQADGSYVRTVTVSVPSEKVTDTVSALWEGQMSPLASEVVSSTQGSVHQFGVTFTASGAEQLALKTSQALNVPDTAAETLSALDQETVGVALQESLELETLLDDPETALFSCNFSLGPGCDALMLPQDTLLTLSEDAAETSDAAAAADMTVGYHRPFGFSSLTVITDLTDPWGKLGRTIRYTVPLTVADAYHQKVRDALGSSLVRGQTLEIYDTADERRYEIRYQSWFPRQMTEMTQAQFPGAKMALERAWFPWLTSRLEQTWGSPAFAYAAGTEVSWQILLPDGTEVTGGNTEGRAAAGLAWQDLSRRAFLTGGVLLGGGLVLVVLVLVLVFRLRRRWQTRRTAKAAAARRPVPDVAVPVRTPPAADAAPQDSYDESLGFCEMCGAPLRPGQKFCGRCGHRRV